MYISPIKCAGTKLTISNNSSYVKFKGTNVNHTNNSDSKPTNNCNDNKTRNVLYGVATSVVAFGAAVYGVKKFQVKNIKNIQKAFQEVFMRDDISIEETREILRRYKEIEKIKDKQKYTEALFEEAKKNFGMEKTDIKLSITERKGLLGFCERDNSAIGISPTCPRREILDTMHHEFRHAKQHAIIYSEYPEVAKKNYKLYRIFDVLNKVLKGKSSKKAGAQEKFEDYLQRNYVDCTPERKDDKYKEYARKLKDGQDNYVSSNEDEIKYWNNFTEQDARKSGRVISKYVKAKAFTPEDFITDFMYKYFPKIMQKCGV